MAGKDIVSWSSRSPCPPDQSSSTHSPQGLVVVTWQRGRQGQCLATRGQRWAQPAPPHTHLARTPGSRSALPASGASPSAQRSPLLLLPDLGYEKGPSFLSPRRARRRLELVSPTSSHAVALAVGPQDRPTAPKTQAPQRLNTGSRRPAPGSGQCAHKGTHHIHLAPLPAEHHGSAQPTFNIPCSDAHAGLQRGGQLARSRQCRAGQPV